MLTNYVSQYTNPLDLKFNHITVIQPRTLEFGQFQQTSRTDRAGADHIAGVKHD